MLKRSFTALIVFAALAAVFTPVMAQTEKDNPKTSNGNPPQAADAPFDAASAKRHQEAWARHLSVDVTMKNAAGMQLILIPPGKFRMGSPPDEKDRGRFEGPVDVTLTKAFYLGRTEVTQAQWRAVMGTTPWKGKETIREGDGTECHILYIPGMRIERQYLRPHSASQNFIFLSRPAEASHFPSGLTGHVTTRFHRGLPFLGMVVQISGTRSK
jgi:formylglycine-generating enzyme required for sulfatase activity